MPDSVISGNNLSKDKAEHFWETLKQLGVYCRKHWWSIFLSVFFFGRWDYVDGNCARKIKRQNKLKFCRVAFWYRY